MNALITKVTFIATILSIVLPLNVSLAQTSLVSDPNKAKFVTSDIQLFWTVLEQSTDDNLADKLKTDYIGKGTDAVRDFVPYRIVSGSELAKTIQANPERYSKAVRDRMNQIPEYEKKIRAAYYSLKYLYPPAVFPTTYFVVGRLNTGGTISSTKLLIGAEMYAKSDEEMEMIPHIVAHEWTHFNQSFESQETLLEQSLYEGGADFISELATGKHINGKAHLFGNANEELIWRKFMGEMQLPFRETKGWMYGGSPFKDGPNDLGYFVGYKICESYYNNSTNKQLAIYDILNVKDAGKFLKQSQYEQKFLSQEDIVSPTVVSTSPSDKSTAVSPDTSEIVVVFNIPMDGKYSVNPVDTPFPKVDSVKWNDDKTKFTLSVKLEADTLYRLTFNSEGIKAFASNDGQILEPHVIEFTTGPNER